MRILFFFSAYILIATVASAEPMTFRSVSNGGNFLNCCWTVAVGEVTADTPAAFDAYAARERSQGYGIGEIRIEGFGEDVEAGMALGRRFREAEAITTLGRSAQYDESSPWFERAPGGTCEGACAYAFLGGRSRSVPVGEEGGGRLGLSQFHRSEALTDVDAKPVSGEERELARVRGQILTGRIVQYLRDMEVAAALYTIAAGVRPTDPVRYLTREELLSLRIETATDLAGPWTAEAMPDRLLAVAHTRNTNRSLHLYCLNDGGAGMVIEVADGSLSAITDIAGPVGTRHLFDTGNVRFQTSVSYVRQLEDGAVVVGMATNDAGAAAAARAKVITPVADDVSRVVRTGLFELFAFPEITGDERLPLRVLEMCG